MKELETSHIELDRAEKAVLDKLVDIIDKITDTEIEEFLLSKTKNPLFAADLWSDFKSLPEEEEKSHYRTQLMKVVAFSHLDESEQQLFETICKKYKETGATPFYVVLHDLRTIQQNYISWMTLNEKQEALVQKKNVSHE